MAASVEAICNMALGFAGVTAWITSIDGKQASAQACKVYYDEYRRDLLSEYEWNFAIRRQVLNALVGVTRSGWSYVAALPGDFLDMDSLMPYAVPSVNSFNAISPPFQGRTLRSEERIPYAIEDAQDGSGNQILLMDLPQATAIYVADITNPTSFPSAFDKALAWSLSVPLCLALKSDPAAAQRLEVKAMREISNAVAKALRRKREDPEPVSEFEASRE